MLSQSRLGIFLSGTRKSSKQIELVEVYPDFEYRSKQHFLKHPVFSPKNRHSDFTLGAQGDINVLNIMIRKHGTTKIVASGMLLDTIQQGTGKRRQPCLTYLRRLWRKGLIRRFKSKNSSIGVWYMLSPQSNFFVDGEKVHENTSAVDSAVLFQLDDRTRPSW